MKTLKNKILAVILVILGAIPMIIDKDATMLVFVLCFVVPVFFSKENWVV